MENQRPIWGNPIIIIGILALIVVLGLSSLVSYMTNSSKTKSVKVIEKKSTNNDFDAVYGQAKENLQVIIDETKIPDNK